MAAEAKPIVHRCCDDENHKPVSSKHVQMLLVIIKKMGQVMIKNEVFLFYIYACLQWHFCAFHTTDPKHKRFKK